MDHENDAGSDSDLSTSSSASFGMSKIEAVISVLKQKQEASHENAAKKGSQQLTVPDKAWLSNMFCVYIYIYVHMLGALCIEMLISHVFRFSMCCLVGSIWT